MNEIVESLIDKYHKDPPEKSEAYNNASKLESNSFESFYQLKMTDTPQSNDMNVFQKLNEDSKDHAERIKELLENSLGKW